VAHELKNPLTAARSTAEALSYAKTPEQRDQLVVQIGHELKRLNRLITDISSASRLEAELARQEIAPVPILSILKNVASAFGDKAEARKAILVLDLPKGAKAGTFTVPGNELRLGQVATNLVDNAVSFAPEGSTVTIAARRDGGFVEVTVEDEGPGIDEDKLETIFARFYTYRPTAESSRGDNSGLGLNISREIVLAHGGRIWAENRYGEPAGLGGKKARTGARFIVTLPASDETG